MVRTALALSCAEHILRMQNASDYLSGHVVAICGEDCTVMAESEAFKVADFRAADIAGVSVCR